MESHLLQGYLHVRKCNEINLCFLIPQSNPLSITPVYAILFTMFILALLKIIVHNYGGSKSLLLINDRMQILLIYMRRFLLDDITEMFVIAFIKNDPIELGMQLKTADNLCSKKF